MTPLAQWLVSEVLHFALVSARAAGVVIVAPLAWSGSPVRIRVALVLVLSMVGFSLAPAGTTIPEPVFAALALATEFAVGVAMGFVVRLAVAAVEIAGEVMAPAIGLGAAQVFDPGADAQQNALAKLLRYLVILLALSVGLHRVLVGSLLASYRVLPAGIAEAPAPVLATLLRLSAEAFEVGVRLSLPVLAVLFMTQIALAFIARAAPTMQIFNLGFGVMLVVGGLMMVLLLPDMARAMLADLSHVGTRIEALLLEMGARP